MEKNIAAFLLRIFKPNFKFSIPPKNSSKYPKLTFQKTQLNILKKIEKLAKLEKIVKLALSNNFFFVVSIVFFDTEQLLIYKDPTKNAS